MKVTEVTINLTHTPDDRLLGSVDSARVSWPG